MLGTILKPSARFKAVWTVLKPLGPFQRSDSSLASHPYFSRVCMHVIISGWRKGKKNTSGPHIVYLWNVIILHIHMITDAMACSTYICYRCALMKNTSGPHIVYLWNVIILHIHMWQWRVVRIYVIAVL